MCDRCEKYKNKSDYNFCPFCGEKLRECIFIPFTKCKYSRLFTDKTTLCDTKNFIHEKG